jgi:glutaminyl-peptide cyclotransferase
MRPTTLRALALPLSLAAIAAVCQAPPPEPAPSPVRDPADFSGERAWEHLRRLAEIGPRAAGTPGAERARAYILEQLEMLGLEVVTFRSSLELEDGRVLELESLVAGLPGTSDDLFVLAAPYDSRHFESFEFVGANEGGSGAALLLELARVLSLRPLPYTTWIVFLDAEAPLGRGNAVEASTAWIGSSSLARDLGTRDGLSAIRLLAYFNQVADADLRISRDLRSHRSYRETFWDVAARLGHDDVFMPAQPYESPPAGHIPFLARGMRRVVLVMDTSFGGEEPPGIYAGTEDDTLERCSSESLEAVGAVTYAALDEIAGRLRKIDRFAGAPLEFGGEPASIPRSPAPRSSPTESDGDASPGAPATERHTPAGTVQPPPASVGDVEPPAFPPAAGP